MKKTTARYIIIKSSYNEQTFKKQQIKKLLLTQGKNEKDGRDFSPEMSEWKKQREAPLKF